MNDFEKISLATEKYIKLADVTDINDIKLMKNLNSIIINQDEKKYNYNYKNKVDLKTTIKYVSSFLDTLTFKYREYFELRLNDGTFIFEDDKENVKTAYSTFDDINKKRIMYIPLKYTLEDSFSIVHELMHDINLDENCESVTRMFYTEALSILAELLLEDYFIKENIKDAKIPTNYSLYCAKSKSVEVDFNLKLLINYLENGYIDNGVIFKILEQYSSNYVNDLVETITKIIDSEELTLDFEQPYIIGTLIATYMHNRIKENKNQIRELFELNEKIKEYEFDQVLDYLDLTYNNVDLTDESYKKLELNYKKYIKSR
jgi:hypothetical protein